MKPRKIPMRKCVVTNEQHPKGEMFRIVRTAEGPTVVDLTGKVRGRGAYLSKNKEVILMAMKRKYEKMYVTEMVGAFALYTVLMALFTNPVIEVVKNMVM